MRIRRVGALTLWLVVAGALLGCDPTFAIVVDNKNDQPVLVGRLRLLTDGTEALDVVIAPGSTRTTLGANGVASLEQLQRVVLMTERCDVIADELLTEGFVEGGTITVSPDLTVAFAGGGNPSRGGEAVVTDDCLETIQQLEP